MTEVLAPLPKLAFTDSNGAPLSGGLLFTYVAGTTTKQTTYTDSTGGSPNTNPIVLSSRGDCNCWFPANQYFKFTLAPATDTDPPTNPIWTVDNITAANVATIFYTATATSAVSRTLQSRLDDDIYVTDFGAVGDGTTDCTAAINACNSSQAAVIFPPGTYLISAGITLTAKAVFKPGASLTAASGYTVTFNGQFEAPLQKVFGSNITAVFDVSKTMTGYPEWWGAISNSSGFDCTAAINACIVALPVTQFQDAEYWHGSTIQATTNFRTIQGVPGYPYVGSAGVAEGSQLVLNSATLTQIIVGATGPTGGATTAIDIRVRDCCFVRGTAPTANGSTNPIGMLIGGTLFPSIENVIVLDSCTDFYLNGNIQANLNRTYAGRANAATNPGSDLWYGYFLNGTSGLSAAGGNASTYLTECKGGCGVSALTASGSVGIGFNGAGADTYLIRCELDTCTTGLQYVGSGGGAKNQSGDADIFITDCIFDGFYAYGMYFTTVSDYGAINVKGGYCAPGSARSAPATACIGINNCGTSTGGNISISGFQGIGWPDPAVAAMVVTSSYGVQCIGNMWNDCGGGTVLTSVFNSRFMDSHNSPAATNTVGAVSMTTCARVYVAPVVTGASGIWTAGVNMNSTGNHFCEVNCTAIDIAACASSHKLLSNGSNITSAGLFNTDDLASGVMN